MANIKIENLTATYENKKKVKYTALDNVSLEIKDSSFNVVVGYSGSGKTTLLRCIAGLMDYDGYIFIDGIDADSLSVQERNMSLVTDKFVLYRSMTIFENIAFPLLINNAPKEEIIERVNEVAKKLHIEHCLSRKPKHLSIGQQQRASLARALIKKPSIYLFDEPLSNLDPINRSEARILIKKLIKETGGTCLYVTHDIKEAMALADYLIVINDKKIEIEGSPLEVYNSGNEIVETLKGDVENNALF